MSQEGWGWGGRDGGDSQSYSFDSSSFYGSIDMNNFDSFSNFDTTASSQLPDLNFFDSTFSNSFSNSFNDSFSSTFDNSIRDLSLAGTVNYEFKPEFGSDNDFINFVSLENQPWNRTEEELFDFSNNDILPDDFSYNLQDQSKFNASELDSGRQVYEGDAEESAETNAVAGETTRSTVTVDGKEREYFVHTPPNMDPDKPLPVVLVYHGVGSNDVQVDAETSKGAENMERVSGFSEKADQEGFIVVYMQGNPDRNMSWNNKELAFSRADDITYTNKVLDDIGMTQNVDPAKVFIAGFSEGGSFVNRAVNDPSLREVFAAGGTVADWMTGKERTEPTGDKDPISMISIHSVDDSTVPYDGAWNWFPANQFAAMKSQDRAQEFYRVRNGITAPPEVSTIHNDDTPVGTVYNSVNPVTGEQVKHIAIDNDLGHVWPGAADNNQSVNATDELWKFFQQHPKAKANPNPNPNPNSNPNPDSDSGSPEPGSEENGYDP